MNAGYQNIYQKARNYANLTQLVASELLFISPKSLANYEAGKTIPPCEVVCKMVEIYGTRWLAYKHLRQSTLVGSKFLPSLDLLDVSDLPRSVLKLQKEVTDVVGVKDSMIDVAVDGEIEEHEEDTWNLVTKEVDEMVGAGLGVLFYQR